MPLTPLSIDGPAGRLAGWSTGAPSSADRLPVLFIHPINMRGLIWEDVAAALAPDRLCVLPDMRAHGESDPSGPFGLEEWASDLRAVLAATGIGRAHLVGGSLGGPLAAVLAAAEPARFASVTAIGSSLNFEGVDVAAVLAMFDEFGVAGTFRRVFPEITFAPGCPEEVVERGIALANPNDTETVKAVWLATITSDATTAARAVGCPSLVLTGEFDATCTPAMGLELARALRTEQVLMPDVGHMPMLEAPARTAELVARHLELAELATTPSGGTT